MFHVTVKLVNIYITISKTQWVEAREFWLEQVSLLLIIF